ncbi:MAG: carbohydrate ABC transporter permease [Oscillospiraceae bacterium]
MNSVKTTRNRIRQTTGDRTLTAVFYVVIAVYSLICLYPLVLAFSVAFSDETAITTNGYSIIPQSPTLNTMRYLLSQRMNMMISAYGMSILVTALGTLVSVTVTLMYAYVLSVPGFRHKNKFAFFAYFTMLFSGGMLPWYILTTKYYHLANTVAGLILPYSMNVFNMFLMRNYLKTIPDALYESAKIDGAGYGRTFFHVALPLSQIGLVTIALFYGLSYWNDFYLPLMLITKDGLSTLQHLLYRMMSNITFLANNSSTSIGAHVQPPMQTARMAMSVLAIGPIIFLYPFVQKYFVKGISLGAIKG